MTHPPIVLFDFDGTIADTHAMFVKNLNHFAGEFGYDPATPEQVREFQHMSAQDIIRQSKISMFKIPLLLRRLKQELNRNMAQVDAIAGMEVAIRELHDQGYQLGIVTSNWVENVQLFLELRDLTSYFTWTYGSSTLFGKHRMLKRFLKQHHLEPQRVIYVGDETRDIEAARASGLPMISVGWGFNAPELLVKYKPDHLIEDAAVLSSTVRSILPR